jgi:anthranilate synthase / indole-3-glycerol phosphate synthase / phosphoribosylanthranilate isomerase
LVFWREGGEGCEARRPGILVDSVVDQGEGEGEGEGERVSGGTGKTCDWTKARELVDRGEIVVDPTLILPSSEVGEVKVPKTLKTPQIPHFPLPIILAGGLTPTNVRAAIDVVHLWAVDVSTGIERAGAGDGEVGVGKDPRLVKRPFGVMFMPRVQMEIDFELQGDGEDEGEEDKDEGKDSSVIYISF